MSVIEIPGGGAVEVGAGQIGLSAYEVAVANGFVGTKAQWQASLRGGPGDKGDRGEKGWSPLFAIVADGSRRVLQVAGWIGGQGATPAAGQYAGATGLVAAIGDAVDIRGPQGPVAGDDTVTNTMLVNMPAFTLQTGPLSGSTPGDPRASTAAQVKAALAYKLAEVGLDVETDAASAATVDIGAVATTRIRVTGGTTITSLGTAANTLRILRFAAALTLTHNATSLILPGAANIVTAAGDVAIFGSDASGNWRCISYQRADGRAQVATSAFIDRAFASYATYASLTALISANNTKPQNAQGTQILSASITTKSATNRVGIWVHIPIISCNAAATIIAGLFRGALADALQVGSVTLGSADFLGCISFYFEDAPGSAGTQNYAVRIGPNQNTAYINGNTGQLFNGATRATMTLVEIPA